MTALLTVSAAFIAVVAAVRSTWSPCGVSMLATVTPLAERARGHRYRSTATWFVAGGLAGGATLGLVMAALAFGVHAAAPSSTVAAAIAGVVALLAAASDTRLGGFRLPFHSRQVNERWLDQFRPWVYGAGFGWQIGAGLATYIKTAALYLMIVLAGLTASPGTALAIGALFGLVRGTGRLAGAGHHRARPPSPPSIGASPRPTPSSCASSWPASSLVAVVFGAALSPWVAVALLLVAAVIVSGRLRRRTPSPARTSA